MDHERRERGAATGIGAAFGPHVAACTLLARVAIQLIRRCAADVPRPLG